MANLVITVPEPTDTSDGLSVMIQREAGSGSQITVVYERNGVRKIVRRRAASYTVAQRTQIQAVLQFIVADAKPEMGF